MAKVGAHVDAKMKATRRVLYGPALTASHTFAAKRMERTSIMHDTLPEVVPGKLALAPLVQAMERAARREETRCSR